MIRYPFPAALLAIPRDRSAVIEASAGTGKTFLIEHLVLDRLLRGDARIDEILVVTFTERATAELIQRVRALIERLLRHQDATPGDPAWVLDDAARARLAAAAQGLDGAPISTIHAFCRRVLTEHAFAGGRLLAQQNVDSRTAFAAAFAETLRARLATDPALAPYLVAWLEQPRGGSVERLEDLLFKVRQLRTVWGVTFDPERLAAAADTFAAEPAAGDEAAVRAGARHSATIRAALERLAALRAVVARFQTTRDVPRLLAAIDELVDGKRLFAYLAEAFGAGRDPRTLALAARLAALAAAAVPLATAVAQRLGPPVEAELAARQRAAGRYDFEDMLSLVRDALTGPRGAALIATLRGRYRLAIIDEFQDTDPVQWEIFRAIFQASEGQNPLYLIGDPKQSIYGFRGADVATYQAACALIATPAETHRLSRNFRSTPEIIDGYNAILDPEALAPYFSSGLAYQPVTAGLPAPESRDAAPPITLLRVTADEDVAKLPMRDVRAALTGAIADEVGRLLASGQRAREIFVLTRTRRESEAVAAALTARGLPHVLYNQEGLYETAEARHLRDLLHAIADPHDPDKRLRAYLSPFFAVPLADLPAAAQAGGADPRAQRLFAWHALARTQDLARLYARVVDETGVIRRELFLGESLRRATNYQQLFDVLVGDAARAARPIADVARWLSALVARIIVPAPEEGNVLRLEGERDAVQIMTAHKAKGLEADVVFVYGGFNGVSGDRVRTYLEGGRRVAIAGRPRDEAVAAEIRRERDAEDQRLYYVALTRARQRLYLPYSGATPDEREGGEQLAEELWRLTGGYRHVNQRLRALLADSASARLFQTIDVPVTTTGAAPLSSAAGLRGWRPDPAALAEVTADAALAGLRRRRAGTTQTSYSRIKQAHGGYQPPSLLSDEAIPVVDEDEARVRNPSEGSENDDDLPGGARAGIFLHALLEELPLEAAIVTPALADWQARDEVRVVIEAALRRHGREPRLFDVAARLAHAALTAPLPVVGGRLDGLGRAARVARELEFLLPFPAAAGGADRGFVKGFVDVIFEHEGRTYFGDWKTDRLPAWDEATVEAHVTANYDLQERLYALALARMLGIDDAAAHEARFGGTIYLFVRGLPHAAAVRSRRPSFADLERWRAELAETLATEENA